MRWIIRLLERYECWRQKVEEGLVRDVVEIQKRAHMRDHGVIVVDEEREVGGDDE